MAKRSCEFSILLVTMDWPYLTSPSVQPRSTWTCRFLDSRCCSYSLPWTTPLICSGEGHLRLAAKCRLRCSSYTGMIFFLQVHIYICLHQPYQTARLSWSQTPKKDMHMHWFMLVTIAVTKIGFKRASLLSNMSCEIRKVVYIKVQTNCEHVSKRCKITLLVERMKHMCTFLYIGALLRFFRATKIMFSPAAHSAPKTEGPETYSLPRPRIECLVTTHYGRMHFG